MNTSNQGCGAGAGAGAGAAGAGTFRPEPEPESEPSEHFVRSRSRSWSRLKKFRLRLQRRGRIIKKKTHRMKCKNVESIIFTAQFLPFSQPGNLEWPQQKSILPRSFPAPPVWTHWTMPSSDCDGTMAGSRCNRAGWGPSNRGEASSFIFNFAYMYNGIYQCIL